jgi:nicotinamidase-related amidase
MAVWDKYLSADDRALIADRPDDTPVVLGSRPALVMVDNWVSTALAPRVSSDSAQQAARAAAGRASLALDRVGALLGEFRRLGHLIVHTTMGCGAASGPDWYSDTRERTPPLNATPEPYAFAEGTEPLENEVVIEKTAASSFFGTSLAAMLVSHRIDTLVVCGESTSGCVRATVVDGASHRFRVAVAADAVYDVSEAAHAINLFDMHRKYATVQPTAEILSYLDGLAVPTEAIS